MKLVWHISKCFESHDVDSCNAVWTDHLYLLRFGQNQWALSHGGTWLSTRGCVARTYLAELAFVTCQHEWIQLGSVPRCCLMNTAGFVLRHSRCWDNLFPNNALAKGQCVMQDMMDVWCEMWCTNRMNENENDLMRTRTSANLTSEDLTQVPCGTIEPLILEPFSSVLNVFTSWTNWNELKWYADRWIFQLHELDFQWD